MNPQDIHYTKEHEWVRLNQDGTASIGITAFAQERLGDIVYMDLPKAGAKLEQNGKLGEVESVKAVSDIYSPISGEVLEVNQEVVNHPEFVNQDPYGKGWLLKVRPTHPSEVKKLMSASEYEGMIAQAAH